MPANRNALMRYKVIDNCLRNRYRNWTLEDLQQECSDALREYEGRAKEISLRTIQGDIQMMRSDKLGYNAPIIVKDKKYYTYEDPDYSITDNPLSDSDVKIMMEAVDLLKQMHGFANFSGMEDIVSRLDDHVSSMTKSGRTTIMMESNERLKGQKFLNIIHRAILYKKVIAVRYKPQGKQEAEELRFSSYVLKEYHNRWYVFGRMSPEDKIDYLILDRILSVTIVPQESFVVDRDFDARAYFSDIVGINKDPDGQPEEIRLLSSPALTSSIKAKPLHRTQRIEAYREDGAMEVSIHVQINEDLVLDIMGYGAGLQVLSPAKLVDEMKERYTAAAKLYGIIP